MAKPIAIFGRLASKSCSTGRRWGSGVRWRPQLLKVNFLRRHMPAFQRQVAQALLRINAVGFSVERPITFKSGILSPVYVDNRRLPYHPEQWRTVIDGFQDLIAEHRIAFDVIAG